MRVLMLITYLFLQQVEGSELTLPPKQLYLVV